MIIGFLVSLAVVIVAMPSYLGMVQRLAWGQQIREEGPQDHQKKQGTPTMGGLIIVLGIAAGCLVAWATTRTWDILVVLGCVLGNTAIGFFDDFAKIRKKTNLGLTSRQKLIAQLIVGGGLATWLVGYHPSGSVVNLPCVGNVHSTLFAFALAIVVMLSTTNGVNLTDGLDGLAAGTVVAASAAYVAIGWLAGRPDLAIAAATVGGACLGFLFYNRYPARIFMGDTGSLALGGALTALAVLTRTEWLLIVIGGIFVIETLSVIIQVSYFKLTHGKRVFKMSPIHHHFCLSGWHETKVTRTFWSLGGVFAALGVLIWYYLRPGWPGL